MNRRSKSFQGKTRCQSRSSVMAFFWGPFFTWGTSAALWLRLARQSRRRLTSATGRYAATPRRYSAPPRVLPRSPLALRRVRDPAPSRPNMLAQSSLAQSNKQSGRPGSGWRIERISQRREDGASAALGERERCLVREPLLANADLHPEETERRKRPNDPRSSCENGENGARQAGFPRGPKHLPGTRPAKMALVSALRNTSARRHPSH